MAMKVTNSAGFEHSGANLVEAKCAALRASTINGKTGKHLRRLPKSCCRVYHFAKQSGKCRPDSALRVVRREVTCDAYGDAFDAGF